MKRILFIVIVAFPFNVFADFIHPMDFVGSNSQKARIVRIIKERVKKDYCHSTLDMCQPIMLRMMEKQNLQAFKKASEARNRVIMDRVIKDYCNKVVDMCNYTTIQMMYEQNLNASLQTLQW